ncbi:helix-loop-helix DNA-binding domain-containing transcription factor [Phycomyces blakesleeanus NRRL 1555(-)]|uniref:Helix-loop-helix DNA-binding domain-containing transcription factor n=2 Tax=Phycomyces blakesleeanus TaxID=4837 RepID=A0A162UHN2_PHYB8|nr:helix-loop-helix DNA-binding domain-containing transcription factor [Phycomyces blakesleeanus NRRL 1555(-)]OAD76302.1 helix-loop-helix DNA-binding domain-containing transcription factor [Phycomyces blakesleeanus NRRL 1555(-)]|eukprot:XP_018294342.1 helix-loop-helix DNA-binding domain-containing transcription factor [Phycomyces blakesleeanus NRRL 1555(-)]
MPTEPPMLVASSSSTTTTSTMSSSSVDYLNETIAKASSLPESFYPEFLQYSKETYEQSTGGGQSMQRKKQRKAQSTGDSKEECMEDSENEEDEEDGGDGSQKGPSPIEIRRQIHIQSEQKRRAQIKDGFEDLRNELPACLNKKMSKVALLHRTVQHIQHLKDNQMSILSDLERLVHENEQLRKFQENILQKQAMDNMYSMSQM